jgi:hypothetical protein
LQLQFHISLSALVIHNRHFLSTQPPLPALILEDICCKHETRDAPTLGPPTYFFFFINIPGPILHRGAGAAGGRKTPIVYRMFTVKYPYSHFAVYPKLHQIMFWRSTKTVVARQQTYRSPKSLESSSRIMSLKDYNFRVYIYILCSAWRFWLVLKITHIIYSERERFSTQPEAEFEFMNV